MSFWRRASATTYSIVEMAKEIGPIRLI